MTGLTPGDRVQVAFMEKDETRRGRPWVRVDVPGVVESLDSGATPGVEVRLDRPVSGLDTCYATYAEVRRAPAGT